MSCSVGLKDIEDFTNELNEGSRNDKTQLTVKRKPKAKISNSDIKENDHEYEKGMFFIGSFKLINKFKNLFNIFPELKKFM